MESVKVPIALEGGISSTVSSHARHSEVQNNVKPGKMRSSCDVCFRMKKKCNREKPSCWGCLRKGYECSYSTRKKSDRNKKGHNISVGKVDCGDSHQVVVKRPKTLLPASPIAIAGVGMQELSFLALYQEVFQKQFPAAAEPNLFARLLSAPPSCSPQKEALGATQERQAHLVALWSGVAVGSLFAGHGRGVPGYAARALAAAEAGGLAAGGGAEVRARLPLALLHDALGQRARAHATLAPCLARAEAEGADDAAGTATLRLLCVLATVCSLQQFMGFILDAIGRGGAHFLGPAERGHAQRAMNIACDAGFLLLKMPFMFGTGSTVNMEAAVLAIHRNLSLAEAELDRNPEDYSPMSHFSIQFVLFETEICALGIVRHGLDRARRKIIPLLSRRPYLVRCSLVGIRAELMAYAFWAAGDQPAYHQLMIIWNQQTYTYPGSDKWRLMPPFSEYEPAMRCYHFVFKEIQPKFELAMRMFLLANPESAEEKENTLEK